MKKTPLQQVKDRFGSKDKLVSELMGLMKRPSDLTKDQFKKKLLAQSNQKLLNLHTRESRIKERFGNRDKLIDSLLQAGQGKNKKEDSGYRLHLEKRTNGQLLDMARRHSL
jgi:hypothetical protein